MTNAWFDNLPVYKPDPKFAVWMAKVDAFISKKFGVDSSDLPDWNYLDAFEDGMSPSAAAKAAIRAAN